MYIGDVLAQIALNYEMKGKGEQFWITLALKRREFVQVRWLLQQQY